MAIIGISGKMGSGKNTVASIIQKLQPERHWEQKAFAGKLKAIASLLTGISVESMESHEVKNGELDEKWHQYFWSHYKLKSDSNPLGRMGSFHATEAEARQEQARWSPNFEDGEISLHKPTLRWMLQNLGTEAIRRAIHPEAWTNALFADYKPVSYWSRDFGVSTVQPNWIITDVRFENEAESVRQRGGILIRINRKSAADTGTHPSETELDGYQGWDWVIYNDGNDLAALESEVISFFNHILRILK